MFYKVNYRFPDDFFIDYTRFLGSFPLHINAPKTELIKNRKIKKYKK